MNNLSIKERTKELFPTEFSQIEILYNFDKLESFYKFLKEYNERGGFFSKSDSENILDRHIIESMYHVFKIVNSLKVSHETNIVDIGSGPGLPGYIFFCLQSVPFITLVDSQTRRLSLLEKFHQENFSDSKLRFIYSRVEDLQKTFDFVIMRSTIKYPWSSEMIYNLLKINSRFIPFLGKRNYDLNFEETLLSNLGLKIEKEIDLKELEFLGNRHIKVLIKKAEAKKGFPRKWETISKEIKRTSWEK